MFFAFLSPVPAADARATSQKKKSTDRKFLEPPRICDTPTSAHIAMETSLLGARILVTRY